MSQQFRITFDRNNALRMSCQNANCEHERNGWVTVLDRENTRHMDALRHLKADRTRRFIELPSETAADYLANHAQAQGLTDHAGKLSALISRTPPGMLILVFPPGQGCLRGHRDREVSFAHRSPKGLVRIHTRPLDFNEDMNDSAYKAGILR